MTDSEIKPGMTVVRKRDGRFMVVIFRGLPESKGWVCDTQARVYHMLRYYKADELEAPK